MKIFLLFIIVFLLFPIIVQSNSKTKMEYLENELNTLSKKIDSNQAEINELKKIIEEFSSKIEFQGNQINGQTNLISTSFDGVSTQLNASSNFIGIFGFIIAIFSIGLSLYVGRIARSIDRIKQDNETLLQKNVSIKQEIELLSEKIINDTKGLYKVIRTEEANHILDRLISVPEDINNMFSNLASRELDENHYLKMREAFIQVKDEAEFADSYLIQFFQHFTGFAIIDDIVKDELLLRLEFCVECSFKNDIVNSTQEYITAVLKNGLDNSLNEINVFTKVIGNSKYKDFEDLYFSVFNSLLKRRAQFDFYQKIDKVKDTENFRKNFGKLLEDYIDENPTDEENIVFEEIKNLN